VEVSRRVFISGAGAALGAFAVAVPGASGAARSRQLTPLAASDRRVATLRKTRSARLAERAFGRADWSAVQAGQLSLDGATGDRDEAYFVSLAAHDGTPTLLILSDPATDTAERRALHAAAGRAGDEALFSDDVVVQLQGGDTQTLRWTTTDGRLLATREVSGARMRLGDAAMALAGGLDHSAFAFGVRLRLRDGAAGSRLLLHRAAARGKASVRRCGTPLAALAA
jgi:hypothetical protein